MTGIYAGYGESARGRGVWDVGGGGRSGLAFGLNDLTRCGVEPRPIEAVPRLQRLQSNPDRVGLPRKDDASKLVRDDGPDRVGFDLAARPSLPRSPERFLEPAG